MEPMTTVASRKSDVLRLSPRWMAEISRQTGHRGLAVCANGALVYDLHTEQVVQSSLLEEEAADLPGAEVMQADLHKIAANAQHLLSLINDVLDLSKIEAGRMEVQTEDFDATTLLRDVAEIDEPALQASLDRLADADLLFVEGAPPEAKYRFKHALIQDAAYESLLKSRRQALHRRAAEASHEVNAEPATLRRHVD